MHNHKTGSENENDNDRRGKRRFAIQRELRFKVLENERVTMTGVGNTIDISSGGVAFQTGAKLRAGLLMELSISWPVLLDETCLMRLVVFGHIVRARREVVACTIDRYEFRTQAKAPISAHRSPFDATLRRWLGSAEKEVKTAALAQAWRA